ncbi:MAG: hypothetical protein ACRDX8_07430 [Acidimicrobiales bacterium]
MIAARTDLKAWCVTRGAQALAHLGKVNGWSFAQAQDHTEEAFEPWAQRSAHDWELDLSVLRRAGLHPVLRTEPTTWLWPGPSTAMTHVTRVG